MVGRAREKAHELRRAYMSRKKEVLFMYYTIVLRTLPNTLGRGAPAALRPPWRPSVPVLTRQKDSLHIYTYVYRYYI